MLTYNTIEIVPGNHGVEKNIGNFIMVFYCFSGTAFRLLTVSFSLLLFTGSAKGTVDNFPAFSLLNNR